MTLQCWSKSIRTNGRVHELYLLLQNEFKNVSCNLTIVFNEFKASLIPSVYSLPLKMTIEVTVAVNHILQKSLTSCRNDCSQITS